MLRNTIRSGWDRLGRMRALAFVLSAVALLGHAQTASATFTLTFGVEFSNSGSTLSGNVVVNIDTIAGGDGVDITVNTNGLDASLSEFITGLYLNVDPALNAANFGASVPGQNTDPIVETISLGTNAFQADGDGLYDVLISWTSAGGAGRFEAGETDVIRLTGTGLDENDFNFLSAPAGGHGPFTAVIRAQGLGSDAQGSGWFRPFGPGEGPNPVPAPAGLILLASAVPMLALRRAFRRKLAA